MKISSMEKIERTNLNKRAEEVRKGVYICTVVLI